MVEWSEIVPGNSFIYYDRRYCYSSKPMIVEIQEYKDGFKGHSLYTITDSNNCPVISPTKELKAKLFEVNTEINVWANYYKALVENGRLKDTEADAYKTFVDTYPEKML